MMEFPHECVQNANKRYAPPQSEQPYVARHWQWHTMFPQFGGEFGPIGTCPQSLDSMQLKSAGSVLDYSVVSDS